MPRISPRSSRNLQDSDESGSEEQEEQDVAIQSGIFKQYLNICDDLGEEEDPERDGVFARALARVQEYLSAGRDNSMCLICLGTIKPSQAIWHCSGSCFAIFHLPCIQEWARNQLESATLRVSTQLGSDYNARAAEQARAAAEWGCPKCRNMYSRAALPSSYTCFCGKEADPEWDPWLAPHTCGQLCGKPLPGHCQHICVLLCHPGPCPPCPLVVTGTCYCGKLTLKQRCGQQEFSCRSVCGRKQSCGHTCPDICHPGPCSPCHQVGVFKCRCGAESRKVTCAAQDFQCTKVCGKPLVCGRHKCEDVCHAGACGGCPVAGSRSCPCGKTAYPGLECDQPAATCGETCGKLLSCGVHSCTERCHTGPCTKVCRDTVTKTCRCGKTQKAVLCHQEVLCEKKCTALRACGRHPCKRRCCDGNCPPCEEVCNRWLRCGNHRCPAPCHTGPCRPCPLTFSVSCACGTTRHTLPCGAEAQAVPPRCARPCPVPPLCRHAADHKPHRCHYGPCPPCRAPCATRLPCSHSCSSSSCHDAPPPAVADWQRPKPQKSAAAVQAAAVAEGEPPAAVVAAAAAREVLQRSQGINGGPPAPGRALNKDAAISSSSSGVLPASLLTRCPPCEVPVTVTCVGGHQQQSFPCHAAGPFSCGEPCGQPLACGNHACSMPCHPTAAAATATATATAPADGGGRGLQEVACEQCSRPCERARSCEHPCPSSCHPGVCVPCEVTQSCSCHCGKTTLEFPCHEYQTLLAQQQQQQGLKAGARKGLKQAGVRAEGDPLCCGKPCHRELEFCRHPCRAACHLGGCPAPERCPEEMTVRCECRRQKQKWACWQVQEALLAAGRGRAYDGTVAPKILSCDAACAAASGKGRSGATSPAEGSQGPLAPGGGKGAAAEAAQVQEKAAAAAAVAGAGAGGKAGARKLSRAEREALAMQKEAERQKQERMKRLRSQLMYVLVLLLVAGVGAGLGLTGYMLLRTFDKKAQAVWGADDEL